MHSELLQFIKNIYLFLLNISLTQFYMYLFLLNIPLTQFYMYLFLLNISLTQFYMYLFLLNISLTQFYVYSSFTFLLHHFCTFNTKKLFTNSFTISYFTTACSSPCYFQNSHYHLQPAEVSQTILPVSVCSAVHSI